VSDNKDKTITVPVDDGTIPVGSIIVVSHVGPLSVPKVTLSGEEGVILQDRALNVVNRWRSAALIKRQENVWLISAGTGGGQTGSVPSPPEITDVAAISGGVHLEWTLPEDDGGHSITANVLEGTTDGFKWEPLWVFQALSKSGDATGLTPGAEYTLRLRSENVIGFSDPSNAVTVVPFDIYNDAEGGAISYFTKDNKRFKRHTFSSSANLIVKRSTRPFVLFACGGGGGGGGGGIADIGYGGMPGGSGGAFNKEGVSLPVETIPITVGNGGTGAAWYNAGTLGGNSSIGTHMVCGGGGGGNFASPQGSAWNGQPTPGNPGSEGGTSTGGTGGGGQTGTTTPATAVLQAKGLATSIGAGGYATGQDSGGAPGGPGQPGIVLVEYEVELEEGEENFQEKQP